MIRHAIKNALGNSGLNHSATAGHQIVIRLSITFALQGPMRMISGLSVGEDIVKSDLTIVTGFFDIGTFGKGDPSSTRSMKTYLEWAKTFQFLQNPLVAYTDSERFRQELTSLRLRANLTTITKIFLMDRNSSWAFRRKEKIKSIFAMKGYPKYYPNTVVPEYSCSMHAKYDVISRAAKENYFHTDYFAWLDIGFFRNEIKNTKKFILRLPKDFNSTKIAVNRVYNVPMNMDISRIFKEKMDWVCGCIFLGKRELILKYAQQYKQGVDYFLSKELMNTDQQVLYAMYSDQGRKQLNTSIELQLFQSHNSGYDPWFYLGYIMARLVVN